MRSPTLTPVVVREDDVKWVVKCQGPDCDREIGVPKSDYDEPAVRGCISHPPHLWVART